VQLSGSIGKHRRVVEVIEQTTEMIGVGVREDDLADGMPSRPATSMFWASLPAPGM
jgi:hypothetical protein